MLESDESRSLSDRARVRRLIDALDRDAVAHAVLRALRASRGLDGNDTAEPRAGGPRWPAVTPVVRDHVRMFTRMLHSGEQPTRAELRALVRQAAAVSHSAHGRACAACADRRQFSNTVNSGKIVVRW